MAVPYALEPCIWLGALTRRPPPPGALKHGEVMTAKAARYRSLEDRLGYTFEDPGLIAQAMTHSSVRTDASRRKSGAAGPDNERLEFLGDRVLGLVIAELLCELSPHAAEGDLARRFNRLVRREACAQIARQLEVGALLTLGGGEAVQGGRDKDTILADACEAVLGAIFIDGGFEAAKKVIRGLWQPLAEHLGDVERDPKSALQEWAQGRGLPLPHYSVIERMGPDHAPRFTAEVRIGEISPQRGEGASKRSAEQAAAETMLAREIAVAAGGRQLRRGGGTMAAGEPNHEEKM